MNEAIQQRMLDLIRLVRGHENSQKIQALADLKIRFKDNKQAINLINKNKFVDIPLDLVIEEIVNPKTTLFTPTQIKSLAPLCQRLKINKTLADDERIHDLADLKAQYDKTAHAQTLINNAAFLLPAFIKAREVANPQTKLFSEKQLAEYRNSFKM